MKWSWDVTWILGIFLNALQTHKPINLIQPLHMSPKVKQQYLASLSGLPQQCAESQETTAKFTGKYWRNKSNANQSRKTMEKIHGNTMEWQLYGLHCTSWPNRPNWTYLCNLPNLWGSMQKVDQEGYEEQITSGLAQALYHCTVIAGIIWNKTEGFPSFSLSLHIFVDRVWLPPNPQGPGISVCPNLVVDCLRFPWWLQLSTAWMLCMAVATYGTEAAFLIHMRLCTRRRLQRWAECRWSKFPLGSQTQGNGRHMF